MRIRAALLAHVNSRLEVTTLDLEEPRSGEVRVRVRAAGVCHSDWHVVTGDTKHPLPAVLGHEGSGIVEAVGEGVSDLQPGDQVALNWAPACGNCFFCSRGRPNLCDTYVGPIWAGTMLDGTTRLSAKGNPVYHYCGLACFAEYIVVPSVSCVKVPQDLPFEIAAVIGCAVTTGVGSVLNTAHFKAGSSAVVFGAGGVGLSTVMGARLAGAEAILAVDPLPARRAAALELGATHAFEPSPNLVESIKRHTGGRGADYAFEAIGRPETQELCLAVTRPGGTVVFSGLSPMGSKTNLPGAVLVREEKTVKGSYYGSANPPVDFLRYAELFQAGNLPLDRLISKTYPLEQINEAFGEMLSGVVRRGVVTFE
ncbi:MAG TPA: Zn-dependent alcohol dehydrogenase [Fimbriimonadaceae bacterium]|nr:Zn-dependent alcohol dehydrogenase [Fimbriimonadaceae bacterium]